MIPNILHNYLSHKLKKKKWGQLTQSYTNEIIQDKTEQDKRIIKSE